jgi:branched-chain amino acid transport system permease protein
MTGFLQQLLNGLMTGSSYAVIGLGFGLVFGVMRVCNVAHAQFFMLGGYVGFVVGLPFSMMAPGLSIVARIGIFVVVVAAAMLFMGLVGVIVERVIVRPLRGTQVMIPFIATAGAATALQYAVQAIFGADPVLVPRFIPSRTYYFAGLNVTTAQMTTLVGMVAMLVGVRYYVLRTRWGQATRAVAEWPYVAAACGVNVDRVFQLTLAISAAAGAVAGVLVSNLYASASPFMGDLFGTKAFICVLVAGNRKIEGMMLIGLIVGIAEALVAGYVSSTYRDAVAYLILVLILGFRPAGLFGSYEE